jgi:hypothetical protein
MADRRIFESRLEERLRAYAARASRPFDSDAIVAAAVAAHRPRRFAPGFAWPRRSMPLVAAALLVLFAVLLAVLAAITLSGRPSELQGDVILPSVPSSVVPATNAPVEPSPSPNDATPTPSAPTVADPHALLVVSSKLAISPASPCINVDRNGTRDGSSRRVIECADGLMLTPDGTMAAVAGPSGMSIVDLRDGHELGTIDTGGFTFPIAWSPSGRWLQWESCRSDKSGPCTVILSARDGSGQHELYRTREPGYTAPTTWLPDESRVAVTTGDAVLVGSGDGSDLRPLTAQGLGASWAGVVDWVPGGRGFLVLGGPHRGNCASICVPVLADVMSQGLSGGANDGPQMNLTNLAPGQHAVAAAWSPDGRTLAFLRKTIDPAVDPYEFQGTLLRAPAELWLRDPSGTIRQIEGLALPEPQDGSVDAWSGRIHWSPDSTRLAIEAGNGRSGSAMSIDTYLVAVDGSAQRVLRDARFGVWSPDGTELAFLHRIGPNYLPDDGPAAPATIEVTGADGTDQRQVPLPSGDFDEFYILWATT